MDRLFTVCYLPVCLLLLGVAIKFNNIPGRPRILLSFAAFTLIMLGLPLVSSGTICCCQHDVSTCCQHRHTTECDERAQQQLSVTLTACT